MTLVANSIETVKAADFPFAGSLILPRLRPIDVPREFATSVNSRVTSRHFEAYNNVECRLRNGIGEARLLKRFHITAASTLCSVMLSST